ncbi:MAG: dipeptidase, partial [Oscillospiraceae bacterium]|nr:dipeptidase [Oscillospiraceae bacterium]
DLSHAGAAAIKDALDVAQETGGTVLFSHSNSRRCCDHLRNITDEQFKKIQSINGVVGLNLYAPFVAGTDNASWENVVEHLEHWMNLSGENIIALGGDWDGCYNDDGTYNMVNSVKGLDEYGVLCDILTKRGWTAAQLDKLFYKNMMRLVESCTTSVPATTH